MAASRHDPPKPQRLRSGARALVYAAVLADLQAVARAHGYALAVHGSLQTDLDLVACPWTEDATDAEALVEAIREAVGGFIPNDPAADPHDETNRNPVSRPHGRRAWTIYHCENEHRRGPSRPYLDISVMPRRRPRKEKQP